jgi:hypothetical protein
MPRTSPRSTRRKGCANWPTQQPTTPITPVSNACSVEAARLDLITNPPSDWHEQRIRWVCQAAGWTGQQMQERYLALNHDALTLESLVKSPPPDWDGETYRTMYRRLQGWKGQLSALDWLMRGRRW